MMRLLAVESTSIALEKQKRFQVSPRASIVIQSASYCQHRPAGRSVSGALSLYLDFINLFLLLRAANR